MASDWIYYLSALLLLAANVVAWAGIFYRLSGHWIIFANCLLFASLLPVRPDGLGLSWFAVCLIGLLALLGDSFHFAVKKHAIFEAPAASLGRSRVLVGAALGSLTFTIAGMAIPVIGPLMAVLGSVAGAASGAWLGSIVTQKSSARILPPQTHRHILERFLTEEQIRILPRIVCGALMVLIALSATLT